MSNPISFRCTPSKRINRRLSLSSYLWRTKNSPHTNRSVFYAKTNIEKTRPMGMIQHTNISRPSNDCNCHNLTFLIPKKTTIVSRNFCNFSEGNQNTIATESILIPRKDIVVVGPSVFSAYRGTPNWLVLKWNISSRKVQQLLPHGATKKRSGIHLKSNHPF